MLSYRTGVYSLANIWYNRNMEKIYLLSKKTGIVGKWKADRETEAYTGKPCHARILPGCDVQGSRGDRGCRVSEAV